MQVTIGRQYRIEAAHVLSGAPVGHKCARLHGHNYVIEVQCAGVPDARGMVVDFWDIDAAMEPLLAMLDHRLLNEVDGLSNPTAELLAQWILKRLPGPLTKVSAVRVWENNESWAEATRADLVAAGMK